MHKNYASQGYSVAYKQIPKLIMWIGSFFDKSADASLSLWGIEQHFDNSLSKDVLGIKFTELEKTLCDMADAMIETG